MNSAELHNPLPWFALQVQSRFEKRVAAVAHNKGFDAFLPLYRSLRIWLDRLKPIELPMLPGYVFCRFDPKDRLLLLIIPGVVQIVGRGKIPIPIDEAEITAMKAASASGLQTAPCPFQEAGRRVRLENGPLAGVEGFLVRRSHRDHLVVSVSLLQRSVAVEIDRNWVNSADSGAGELILPEHRSKRGDALC